MIAQQVSMIPQQMRPEIKALSLIQPWASGVIEGFKKYETRSWRTNYRGLIAIHASKGFPGWAKREHEAEGGIFLETLNRPWQELPLGAILGVVELIGCYRTETIRQTCDISDQEFDYGDWHDGRYCWEFRNVMRLPGSPIVINGALQLWTIPVQIKDYLLNLYEAEYGQLHR